MVSSNMAAKRGAKAARRKAIVVQKRKIERAEATPAGQAARAAVLPIHHCLISKDLFETGMGTLILARGASVGPVFFSAFLLDTFSCGVKDVMASTMEGEQLETYLDVLNKATPLVPVASSYARKLIRDLVKWSATLGFHPPREFKALERLFGDVDPHACQTEFTFGHDGKPLFMSGPNDSLGSAIRHVEKLNERLGPDGFDYMVAS